MQEVVFDLKNCWDCPLSFWDTWKLVVVIVASTTIGIYLRGLSRPRLRTAGNFILAFASLLIFTLNHAGRNWGVDFFGNKGKYSTPSVSSAFALFLVITGISLVIYFDRRSKRKSGQRKTD